MVIGITIWRRTPVDQATARRRAATLLYGDGLSQYYVGDRRAAAPLFRAALATDSGLAMAAYYVARCELEDNWPAAREAFRVALRGANGLPTHERLVLEQAWADATNDPNGVARADSLLALFPDDPDALVAAGRARVSTGDFLGAVPSLRRAIARDAASFTIAGTRCVACDAEHLLISAYLYADSIAAAEDVARDWTTRQPTAPDAWDHLAWVLDHAGRPDSAIAAGRASVRLSSDLDRSAMRTVTVDLRAGRFDEADRVLTDRASSADAGVRAEALWWLALSLRMQGRAHEALSAALAYRADPGAPGQDAGRPTADQAYAQAATLFDLGRFREAAALFDSAARDRWRPAADVARETPSRLARHRVWGLTLVSTARVAAGDTALLPALADTIEALGRSSGYWRDRLLHHYVRGLVFATRTDTAAALAEWRSALGHQSEEYSRINLALGRALLATGRPADAALVLAPPLRASLESVNYYVTHTELHEALAHAFDAAGHRDSAAAHYAWVAAAWRHADAALLPRWQAACVRLATLSVSSSDRARCTIALAHAP
ncbi:MAG TPA: tetratricopeptide repeat protein [Gemmatimonadaceae bacterium]|nr:tetratricopeptide repeat protein [Gemmatimonadaceae bacterium]